MTIDPVFIPRHEEQVARHGLERRVTGVRAMRTDLRAFMEAFEDDAAYIRMRDAFVGEARPLVAAGAEVIDPSGGLPMLLFSREVSLTVDGAVVLNDIATAARATEAALVLHRVTGSVASRAGTYRKTPPEAIAEFMDRLW